MTSLSLGVSIGRPSFLASVVPSLSDRYLLRGAEFTLDVTSIMGGTDGITATGLPWGLTLTDGVISGRAISAGPPATVQLTRGAVDVSASWEVKLASSLRSMPSGMAGVFNNIDVDAVDALDIWDTESLTVGNGLAAEAARTALNSAITTAAADAGTSSVKKLHKIVYQGPHVDETSDAQIAAGTSYDPNTIIVVVADHSTDDYTRVSNAFSSGSLCLVGWEIHGCGQVGSYDFMEGRIFNAEGTSLKMQFVDCRFGTWWRWGDHYLDYLTSETVTVARTPVIKAGASAWCERCEFAGMYGGFQGFEASIAKIDCAFHDLYEDVWRAFFQSNAQDSHIYIVGCASWSDTPSKSHTDAAGQIDAATSSGGTFNVHLERNIHIAPQAQYGSSGARFNAKGSLTLGDGVSEIENITLIDNIFGITGIDAIVFTDPDAVEIDGLIAFPAPGVAGINTRVDIDGCESITLANMAYSSFRNQSASVSGVELVVDNNSSGNADSLDTLFPNLGTTIRTMVYPSPGDYSIVDEWDVYSKQSARDLASARLLRGVDWDDASNLVSDPASWGVFSETPPSAPAKVALTSPSLAIDASTATATVTVDGKCRLHYMVSTSNETLTATEVRQFVLADGTGHDRREDPGQGTSENATDVAAIPVFGDETVAASGTVNITLDRSLLQADTDYYLHVVAKNEASRLGDPVKSAAASYVTPSGVSAPTILHNEAITGKSSTYTTASFTPTGKPLLIAVHRRSDASLGAAPTDTIDIGAGSVALSAVTYFTRNVVEYFYIQSPGTSAVTAALSTSTQGNGTRFVVMEVDGATGVGATTGSIQQSGNSTARTFGVTTTAANSLVVYGSTKSGSDTITVTDATKLYGEQAINAGLEHGAGGYEIAGAAAANDATFTGEASSTFVTAAVEILA